MAAYLTKGDELSDALLSSSLDTSPGDDVKVCLYTNSPFVQLNKQTKPLLLVTLNLVYRYS